jgi:hypothetical protein
VSVVLNFEFLYLSLLSHDSSVSEMPKYRQDDSSFCHHIQSVCEIQEGNIYVHLVLKSTVFCASVEWRLDVGYFWTAQNSFLLYHSYCLLLSVSLQCSVIIFKS